MKTWSHSLFPDRQTRTGNIFTALPTHWHWPHHEQLSKQELFTTDNTTCRAAIITKNQEHSQISCHLVRKHWHPLTTVQCLTSQILFPAPFSHFLHHTNLQICITLFCQTTECLWWTSWSKASIPYYMFNVPPPNLHGFSRIFPSPPPSWCFIHPLIFLIWKWKFKIIHRSQSFVASSFKVKDKSVSTTKGQKS